MPNNESTVKLLNAIRNAQGFNEFLDAVIDNLYRSTMEYDEFLAMKYVEEMRREKI